MTVRDALARLAQGRTTLQGHRLVERLRKRTGLTVIELRRALGELRNIGELRCKDWVNGEPLGKVQLAIATAPPSSAQTLWEGVLRCAQLTDEEVVTLLPAHSVMDDLDAADMREILLGLVRLRAERERFAGIPRFEVSAAFLLGSSKLLDTLPITVLRNFGIDPESFPKFPGYLVVSGPPEPAAVVLVENPHAFEAAMRAGGTDDVAWVVTFGYGLSMRGDDHGMELVEFLTSKKQMPNALVRKGNPPDVARLLAHPEIFFWGDLDPAGLHIFDRLRRQVARLRLSGLYHPMVSALQAVATSHPYNAATGKEGQLRWASGDATIEALLELCAKRGVDQEIVREEQIAALCRLPLHLDVV